MSVEFADRFHTTLRVPPLNECIFIDIETSVYSEHIWMIGCKINQKYYQYTAKNWDDEYTILQEFNQLLLEHPKKSLVCYSRTNFDFRLIWNAAKRHSYFELMGNFGKRAWIDLATLVNRCYTPIYGGIGLKSIGKQLGYDFSNEGMDGFEVSVKYAIDVRKNIDISSDFKIIAENYNKDDLDLMIEIIQNSKHKITKNYLFNKKNIKKFTNFMNSYSNRKHRFRISVPVSVTNFSTEVIMSLGLPIPQINIGKNVTSLVYANKLALEIINPILLKHQIIEKWY